MREDMKIKTEGGINIYGTLDSCGSKTLLIFVHGMTGGKDEHHYFNAAPFFIKNGFDTYRFYFYSRHKGARQLMESTLNTHVDDLNAVVSNFKDKYEKIILISHSFGGIVVPNADLSNISKLVFWDPTSGFSDPVAKNIIWKESFGMYILNWGKNILVKRELIDQWMASSVEDLVDKINVPCKFIFAGNYNKMEIWGPHLDKIKVPHESVIVDGASHGFIEEGTEKKLFEETLKFIKD